jgi:hypothetical protein
MLLNVLLREQLLMEEDLSRRLRAGGVTREKEGAVFLEKLIIVVRRIIVLGRKSGKRTISCFVDLAFNVVVSI